MRFGKKTQVAASIISMTVLAAVTAGCEKKPTPAQEQMASRVEAAASKSEMAANKAEQAARNAADAAAKAQAAADKAEAMFQKHMRK
jgi:hypothetical protein